MNPIPIQDGTLHEITLFTEDTAEQLLHAIHAEAPWEQHYVKLFGRTIPSPRRTVWMGEPGATYRYSGQIHTPHPWTPTVLRVRDAVQQATGQSFNSALANLYRDGQDSMGWHSDDERDLGANPIIASVSLGATRRFLLAHRTDTNARLRLDLHSGSLLVMGGPMQRYWKHAIPKTKRAVGPRVNLTFRQVLVDRDERAQVALVD